MRFQFAPAVVEAMKRAPRAGFLPANVARHAGIDAPLAIGKGQTNSQPTTVAIMLDLLDVRPGDTVLDVGAGSGWTTAILANLVGPDGRVFGVERHASLVRSAQEALEAYVRTREAEGYAGDLGRAEVRLATRGVLGLPAEAPFPRILVSAMADHLPQDLVDQLGEGGVMVIPVAGTMLRVERVDGQARITRHGLFSFVPLVED